MFYFEEFFRELKLVCGYSSKIVTLPPVLCLDWKDCWKIFLLILSTEISGIIFEEVVFGEVPLIFL